jgi:hypothetical protein
MWILVAAREGIHLDEVAAHRFGQCLEIGRGRHHPDLVGGLRAAGDEAGGEEHCADHVKEAGHERLLEKSRTDAPGGRPE